MVSFSFYEESRLKPWLNVSREREMNETGSSYPFGTSSISQRFVARWRWKLDREFREASPGVGFRLGVNTDVYSFERLGRVRCTVGSFNRDLDDSFGNVRAAVHPPSSFTGLDVFDFLRTLTINLELLNITSFTGRWHDDHFDTLRDTLWIIAHPPGSFARSLMSDAPWTIFRFTVITTRTFFRSIGWQARFFFPIFGSGIVLLQPPSSLPGLLMPYSRLELS